MKATFKGWLVAQKYVASVVGSRFANCRTVEAHEGDLDDHYDRDRLASLLARLKFSAGDERAGKPNPSSIPINGNVRNGLATFGSAVRLYGRFRDAETPLTPPAAATAGSPPRIGFERDLQAALTHESISSSLD